MAISLLLSMEQLFPKSLAKETKKHIASCVYSSDAQVRDEAANFILAICGDFDEENPLLEV